MEVGIYKLTDTENEYIDNLTKGDISLRHPDDPNITYSYGNLGNLGNGCYMLYEVNFSWRPVRLYILGVRQDWFGVQEVGSLRSVFVAMDGTTISASNKKITELAAGAAATDAINKSQLDSEVDDLQAYADNVLLEAKAYTDNVVTNLPNLVAPQSSKVVRFWQGATQVTNKIYNNLLYAVESFDLTEFAFATILIEGLTSNIYKAPAKCLAKDSTYSNLTFQSINREWGICFPDGIVNKHITFLNMKVILGAGVNGGYTSSTRQFTNFRIKDCDIYCYNNLALYNGEYSNVNIYMASGKTLTFYGSGILRGVKSNVAIAFDAGFNGYKDYEDLLGNIYIPGGSMPTDPTGDIS